MANSPTVSAVNGRLKEGKAELDIIKKKERARRFLHLIRGKYVLCGLVTATCVLIKNDECSAWH